MKQMPSSPSIGRPKAIHFHMVGADLLSSMRAVLILLFSVIV